VTIENFEGFYTLEAFHDVQLVWKQIPVNFKSCVMLTSMSFIITIYNFQKNIILNFFLNMS